MITRKSRSLILNLLSISLILLLAPNFGLSKMEQVDPNIPEIEGMDNLVEVKARVRPEQTYQDILINSQVLANPLLQPPETPQAAVAASVTDIEPVEFLVSTTAEATPMVYFPGSLGHEQECTVYGDDIAAIQNSLDATDNKLKTLRGTDTIAVFGTKICNWVRARLECVPHQPRIASLATTTGPGDARGQRIRGRCECLLAMGEKAFWFEDEYDGRRSRCVIPANMGTHSECDHDILLPYGEIDESQRVRRIVASAGNMCVPNSDCEIGYLYTGKRCKCRKGTRPDRTQGTCAKGYRFNVSYGLIHLVVGYLVLVERFEFCCLLRV